MLAIAGHEATGTSEPHRRGQIAPQRLSSDTMTHPAAIVSGMTPSTAVEAFYTACKQPGDTLFITDAWFAPFRTRLLAALPDRLTDPLSAALEDALHRRRPLETVTAFIEQQPISWADFEEAAAARERRRRVEQATAGFFPWEDVDASSRDLELQRAHTPPWTSSAPGQLAVDLLNHAKRCPGCDRAPSELTWIYFSSPAWTWEQLCGRAGWLGLCPCCRMQVEFFMDVMN